MLHPRCIVSEFGAFRAARDIPALDWTRPLHQQATCELSIDYGEGYWQAHRLIGSARTPLDVGIIRPLYSLLDALTLDCVGADPPTDERRRSLRSHSRRASELPMPDLAMVESDANGRLVYVNLASEVEKGSVDALRRHLIAQQPTARTLERIAPINRNRILVEIDDITAFSLFRAWLVDAVLNVPPLQQLLESLGPRLLLLGAHFIVPKVTEHDRRILPQTPHTDVDGKGEVISIGMHLHGNPMGTLLETLHGFGRANTPLFAYDTGATHAGPGVAHVPPPYPRYFTERVFFLLCSAALAPASIAQHRRDNGLVGSANFTIDICR